jgi:hypothetical protein
MQRILKKARMQYWKKIKHIGDNIEHVPQRPPESLEGSSKMIQACHQYHYLDTYFAAMLVST